MSGSSCGVVFEGERWEPSQCVWCAFDARFESILVSGTG